MCRDGYCKYGQNRDQNRQNEHEIGTSVESRSREVFFKPKIIFELKMSSQALKESENANISPWNKLHKWSFEIQKIT